MTGRPDLSAQLVVGFGENSLDYVYRLPGYPQPGSSLSKMAIERHDRRVGGQVATTLATCARLGVPTRYLGAFGDDAAALQVRAALADHDVDVSRAMVRAASNRYAVILIDGSSGERVVLHRRDAGLAIAAADVRREWLDDAALVHLDATDLDAAVALAREARARGLPVTCDLDRVGAQTTPLLDLVTTPIFAEHVPAALTGETDVERSLRMIRQRHPGRLVVTLGARGAAMLDGDRYVEAPGLAVTVVDSTGAGDVFRGAFIWALLRGEAPEVMLRLANAAAAMSCTREGALDGVPTAADSARLTSLADDAAGRRPS